MYSIRCTARLLSLLHVRPAATPPPSTTTRLGDWCAHQVHLGRRQFIICVSEHTLLPVVLPARGATALPLWLAGGVREMLTALEVSANVVDAEVREMAEVTAGKTANRRVLGSIMEFGKMLPAYMANGETPMAAALHLAEAPCSPLGMESPREMTVKLLAASQ